MRLPSLSELQKHLQTTLVVNAEVQFLAAGGKLGAQLASLITGTNFEEGTLPTDAFDDAGEHQAAPMGMQQPTSAAKVATQPWT